MPRGTRSVLTRAIPAKIELHCIFLGKNAMITVNDLINAQGVYLILGVQEGAFNRWEAFIPVTYFNKLNVTVYSMLSAKTFLC